MFTSDFAKTLGRLLYEAQPQPMSPCVGVDGVSHSINTRMKEGGGGEKPSNPYVIPVTSQGCFGVGLCWNLGMIQAMIDITSEHNVSKNNQDQLYFQLF